MTDPLSLDTSLSAELASDRVSPIAPLWLCLSGFMGSGKTTIGKALAAELGWPFVDLDELIVSTHGRAIPEIFRSHGEAHFRVLESAALDSLLGTRTPPAVVALGGGTFIQQVNRDRLRKASALTVFLDARADLLFERCCAEGGRPLLQDQGGFWRLYEERRPAYLQAELIVDIGARKPEEIAREIANRVAARTGVSG